MDQIMKRSIEDILKQAQDVPMPRSRRPAAEVPSRGAPSSAPSASPQRGYSPRYSGVKAMQQAILHFGDVLSKNYLMSANDPTRASDPFGSFLVNQYVNNEKVVGKQFVNVDLREPLRSGTAIKNVDLRGIVSTIKRIGTPGSEGSADGIWQTRTNNSLKQIYAVAAALVQLQKDLGIQIEGYDDKDLAELKENIPDTYLHLDNTVLERAAKITANINKLTNYYLNFEKTFLNNEQYKSLITNSKPLFTHKSSLQLTPEEEKMANDYRNLKAKIPGVNLDGHPVSLYDIASLTNFKTFLENNNMRTDDASLQKQVQRVKEMIDVSELGF
jgi:hypothetical protein